MIVGVHLAIEAVEQIETLAIGVPARPDMAEPPLADSRRRVAFLLESFGNRELLVRDRILPGEFPSCFSLRSSKPFGFPLLRT